MNLQPSEAEAGFDIRVPPTTDAESFERRIAEEWAPTSRNMTFEVIINCLSLLHTNQGRVLWSFQQLIMILHEILE